MSAEEEAAETAGFAVTAEGVRFRYADGTLGAPEPETEAEAEAEVEGNGEGETVVAVVYDRRATPSRERLEARLAACRSYAAERGWRIAAEHVDSGDDALRERSRRGLEAAIAEVERAAKEPGVGRAVLLVHDDGRISHDAMTLAGWCYRVDMAGGEVATVEQDEVPRGFGYRGPAVHQDMAGRGRGAGR